jgi:Tfp pilus assembly PilM family ATPase
VSSGNQKKNVPSGEDRTASSSFVKPVLESSEVIAGLMLWETHLAVAVVQHQGGRAVLTQAGEFEFPADSSDAQRSKLLKKWWRKKKFKTHSVWIGVYPQGGFQKYFSLPVAEDAVRGALALEVEDSLQMSAENIVFDYFLYDRKKKSDPCSGMLFACPRQEILRRKKILQDAGLLVCGVGVPSVEFAKTFRWLSPVAGSKFAEVLLLLTERTATIVILYGESSFYSRVVECSVGGWKANPDYLVQSINDAVVYFQLYLSEIPVGRINVAGLLPRSYDIIELLLRETGLMVQQWNPLAGTNALSCSPSLAGAVPDLAVGALGLAIRRD